MAQFMALTTMQESLLLIGQVKSSRSSVEDSKVFFLYGLGGQ